MDLKRVTIGYYNEKVSTGIIEQGYTVCKFERIEVADILCVVDKFAVDIDDFDKRYEIIERDEYGRIISDIKLNKMYALEMRDVNKSAKRVYKKRIKEYKKLNHKV